MKPAKHELTINDASDAEEQLRFVLNFAESMLCSLETVIGSSTLHAKAPEVSKAYWSVANELSKLIRSIRNKRAKASQDIRKRALKIKKVIGE